MLFLCATIAATRVVDRTLCTILSSASVRTRSAAASAIALMNNWSTSFNSTQGVLVLWSVSTSRTGQGQRRLLKKELDSGPYFLVQVKTALIRWFAEHLSIPFPPTVGFLIGAFFYLCEPNNSCCKYTNIWMEVDQFLVDRLHCWRITIVYTIDCIWQILAPKKFWPQKNLPLDACSINRCV